MKPLEPHDSYLLVALLQMGITMVGFDGQERMRNFRDYFVKFCVVNLDVYQLESAEAVR